MTIDVVRDFLIWSTLINLVFFLWWVGFFIFGHEFIYKMHTKWFVLSRDRFDAIHYAGMLLYKMAIIVFNLVPLAALSIVG